nr:MAG TPA: Portal [Bacteriophage sp.]
MRNKRYLQDIVKGCYGRKIAYTNVSQITRDNIVSVVGSCIGCFNYNKTVIEYLWNYYKGDQPVHYREKTANEDINNRVSENHAYELVQFKVGQTYGEPIQFISRRDDDAINKAVGELNDYMADANKQEKDIKAGEWQSATGTSFKAIQFTGDKELPFRIVAPNPINTFVIYNESTEEPMLAVQELKDEKGEHYKLCYTKSHECKLKNGKVLDWQLHGFGDIPIVEYPNNHERLSDIELVIDLLDAINNMQSNRMDSIQQFVEYWVKFVNCEIDKETFEEMKLSHALTVKSNNKDNKADVEIMTQELNQSESQVAKKDLWDNALAILAIPNKEGNTGGDTQGAVELRNGWDFSKTRTKLKDPVVKSAEKRIAKVVLNVIRVKGKEELKIGIRDFDVQINHSPTDNLVVKCQALQYLLQCGIHPLVAIKTVGLWGDAEKTFLESQPYLKNLWKTIDDVKAEEEEAKKKMEDFNNQQNKATIEE